MNIIPAGHKLGEPSPLFAKIEPARIEELKKKFAGEQEEKANAKSGAVSTGEAVKKNDVNPEEIKGLEEEVEKQVRDLMEL